MREILSVVMVSWSVFQPAFAEELPGPVQKDLDLQNVRTAFQIKSTDSLSRTMENRAAGDKINAYSSAMLKDLVSAYGSSYGGTASTVFGFGLGGASVASMQDGMKLKGAALLSAALREPMIRSASGTGSAGLSLLGSAVYTSVTAPGHAGAAASGGADYLLNDEKIDQLARSASSALGDYLQLSAAQRNAFRDAVKNRLADRRSSGKPGDIDLFKILLETRYENRDLLTQREQSALLQLRDAPGENAGFFSEKDKLNYLVFGTAILKASREAYGSEWDPGDQARVDATIKENEGLVRKIVSLKKAQSVSAPVSADGAGPKRFPQGPQGMATDFPSGASAQGGR